MKQKNAESKTANGNARETYANNRIATLDKRLGVGVGAKRERERLGKILAK